MSNIVQHVQHFGRVVDVEILGVKTFVQTGRSITALDREIDEWCEIAAGNGLSVLKMETSCTTDEESLWIVTQLAYGRSDEVAK